MCLAETLDHLSTVWHLVDVCPTVLLEDLKANRVISGKDYYAMLHVHTVVRASLFTIQLEELARWLINEEKYMEYMSMHAWLQCPSTPSHNVTAEFHLPTTKLWLIYMNMMMILKR